MLDISADALNVLAGSWTPLVRVDAWYDGQVALADVPVNAGSISHDASRATTGAASITAATNDDSLVPASWDAPLACYGSELTVQVGIPIPGRDPEWFSLGWFRIDSFTCQEWYQPYDRPDGTVAWIPRGTQVDVECSDRWALIDDAKFAIPEQPASLASVIGEIQRLVDGIVPVEDLSGVTDAAIPKSITYSDARADTLQQLAAVLSLKARMSRDGALTLVPVTASGTSVWTVDVAPDAAAAVLAYARKGDRAGLYNQVVSSGAALDGTPTQAVTTTTDGPLRFGGPLGRIPYLRSNPLLTTNAACASDAAAQLVAVGGAQTVDIPLTVPLNPALEVGDTITAVLPTLTLPGVVQSRTVALGQATMDLVLAVSRQALWGTSA